MIDTKKFREINETEKGIITDSVLKISTKILCCGQDKQNLGATGKE